jgi:branched-chain amino acid transport system substrate-binding protein
MQSKIRGLAAIVLVSAVAALGISGVAGAAAAGPAQGVTDNSIKIGFIYSKTGVASSTAGKSDLGCKARVGRENKAGGVNGRKLDVTYVDDASSGQNLTAAQDLVQNKRVYLLINDSAFAFLTYRWALDNDVAYIGGGFDGTHYGQAGNEKLISALGNSGPDLSVTFDTTGKIMKALGGTKVAAVGYGISQSSSLGAKLTADVVAPAVGMEGVYTNTTVDFGTTDVSPVVLGIKNSGADAAYYTMNANTNLAIAAGLLQNGVKMKAQLMATGYGEDLLKQPVAKQIGTDVIMMQLWAPVELKTAATKRFQADLSKYADYTGVPDFGIYTGYISCDLATLGLKAQGKNLDPAAWSDTLRNKVGEYNVGDGLGCRTTYLTPETFGKASAEWCTWALYVKDGKFRVLRPKGSKETFWNGKLIPTDTSTTSGS